MSMDFEEFPKLPRLTRECVITEKLDGTNAQIAISDDLTEVRAGSRTRWIEPTKTGDNYGFARWVEDHREELLKLGPGRHYGEWWGAGVQRGYGLNEKRFSLFNVHRWSDDEVRPACCHVVPTIYSGVFSTNAVNTALADLELIGSFAAPGFMKPEGVIVYHVAARQYFKKTIEKDEEPKGARVQT